MFAQFRIRYPQGSIITELLTVDNGKYIVRSLIQVDGITLATGMAAAETVELAEDRARIRALAVLDISPTTSVANSLGSFSLPEPAPLRDVPAPQAWEPNTYESPIVKSATYSLENGDSASALAELRTNPVLPLVDQILDSPPLEIPPTSEPMDISAIIDRTDVEMKRLGWTKEQGRNYIKSQYGKKMRAELSNQQLLEFLHYLELQPNPED